MSNGMEYIAERVVATHPSPVRAIASSTTPNPPSSVAYVCEDGALRCRRLDGTIGLSTNVADRVGTPHAIAYSLGDEFLAVGGDHGLVVLAVESGKEIVTWQSGPSVTALCFTKELLAYGTRNGDAILVALDDWSEYADRKRLCTWPEKPSKKGIMEGRPTPIVHQTVLGDRLVVVGKSAIATYEDRLWSGKESELRLEVTAAALSDDDCLIALGGSHGNVDIWTSNCWYPVRCLHDEVGITGMLFDNGRLLTGRDDGVITVWDISAGVPIQRLHGHRDCVSGMARTGDGVLSGGIDGRVVLWGDCGEAAMVGR